MSFLAQRVLILSSPGGAAYSSQSIVAGRWPRLKGPIRAKLGSPRTPCERRGYFEPSGLSRQSYSSCWGEGRCGGTVRIGCRDGVRDKHGRKSGPGSVLEGSNNPIQERGLRQRQDAETGQWGKSG